MVSFMGGFKTAKEDMKWGKRDSQGSLPQISTRNLES